MYQENEVKIPIVLPNRHVHLASLPYTKMSLLFIYSICETDLNHENLILTYKQ